jgi:acetyl esterase/lipase
MATEFARRGYVCVSTDYRVRERPDEDRKATLQDALDDCRAALAWLRENSQAYGVNPARIAIGGGSAGGMVAVNLASVENDAARKSGIFALMDLWGSPNSLLMPDEIGTRFPPTVIVHGTADQSVAFGQSEQLAARLKEKGVRHLLHPIPGAAHTPMEHMDEIIDVTAKFLYSALVAA